MKSASVPNMSRPNFPTGSSNAAKAAAHGNKKAGLAGGKEKAVKAMGKAK